MQPLLRPEFRPEPWSPADLDAAADHWLWLFDQAPATAGRTADHRTELRLRGFPNSQREAVAAALAKQLPDAEVTRPDADTFSAVGPTLDFETSPPPGLGVPALAGPPFDGLYLEVRFTATARKRNGKPHATGTLVFAGELGPEGLTVYVVWGEGGTTLLNAVMTSIPWPREAAWREGFEAYRDGGPATIGTREFATAVFTEPRADRVANASIWLMTIPPAGKPREVGTLARLATNFVVGVAGVAFTLVMLGSSDSVAADVLRLAGFAVSFLSLALFLRRLCGAWLDAKRVMTDIFRRLYSGSPKITPADAAKAADFLGNPYARKAVADWQAVASHRAPDATLLNPGGLKGGLCFLHAPDKVTHVSLLILNQAGGSGGTPGAHLWPALVAPTLTTRFPGGGVAVTVANPVMLFRRKLTGPESVARVHPGVADPAELLERHADLCREYAGRTGLTPLPAIGFDDYVRWQHESSEDSKRLYAHNPVTWSDAFVMLMGYVRRAYR